MKPFVRSCESCQRNKSGKIKVVLLQPLPIPDRPWAHISMDFIVGLPQTDLGFNAIFTFVDRLMKYVHLIPKTSNADAREGARLCMNYIFPHHGLIKSIVSDRDPKFTSAFFQEVFTILGTQLCLSTANHPQTDGLTEEINRVVENTLRTFVNHRRNNWDNLLPLCQFAINNGRQWSTDHTPFFLNHGYDLLTPSSLVDLPTSLDLENSEDDPIPWTKRRMEALASDRDALTAAQAHQAFYSDRGRAALNVGVGDQVLVHRELLVTSEARARPCPKFHPKWFGLLRRNRLTTAARYHQTVPQSF